LSRWFRPLPARCYVFELNYADGVLAAAIQCRQGGVSSTSDTEALHRSSHRCSKPSSDEVMCSPWFEGGLWLKIFAGMGLPSNWSLLLGGDAWRTPASGRGGVLGLYCKIYFCSRVLFVKRKALSLNRRFHRANCARAFLHIVPATC
jgi:hypothetical protein